MPEFVPLIVILVEREELPVCFETFTLIVPAPVPLAGLTVHQDVLPDVAVHLSVPVTVMYCVETASLNDKLVGETLRL